MSNAEHETTTLAGVRTRRQKRGLKCWTRFNRNGGSYIVCNGSRGQASQQTRRRTRKQRRRTKNKRNPSPVRRHNTKYKLRRSTRLKKQRLFQ